MSVSKLLKYAFLCGNILIGIICTVFIVIASKQLHDDDFVKYAMIGITAVLLPTAMFGVTTCFLDRTMFLKIYNIIFLIIILVMVGVTIVAFFPFSSQSPFDIISKDFEAMAVNYYKNDTIKEDLDKIHWHYKCCGYRDPVYDYHGKIPWTCCAFLLRNSSECLATSVQFYHRTCPYMMTEGMQNNTAHELNYFFLAIGVISLSAMILTSIYTYYLTRRGDNKYDLHFTIDNYSL